MDFNLTPLLHLLAALAAGGLIGLERSHHGRPAGFRTHALVCLASGALMQLPALHVTDIDAGRLAQGIMTGIGFLGAGVIMKERLSIRGLTTAASIWITAAIGILLGLGHYVIGGAVTALTLSVLALFRWIEVRMPTQHYARLEVKTRAKVRVPLDDVLALARQHGCEPANPNYALQDDGKTFAYDVVLTTGNWDNYRLLADALADNPKIPEFKISPASQ
ncbi:MAG: MgtC/SapB family protein [Gammaproteobacteria bacterium]|jgi:putative Mg2+ transporter-C (MgtC) family protein|nr:MAG: MgtC/SapB family protein [Gammaproteobacteria bacterium]